MTITEQLMAKAGHFQRVLRHHAMMIVAHGKRIIG
jgi:hypothetical protein